MKNLISISILVFFTVILVLISGCRKDDESTVSLLEDVTEIQELSSDENEISSSLEDVEDDVNTAFNSNSLKLAPCGNYSVVRDTAAKTLTITFSGNNCKNNRSREGVVIAKLTQGASWADSGAVIEVTYDELKITRLSTGKYITISGTRIHKNITGGRPVIMTNGDSIVHQITSTNMSILFSDGTSRLWSVHKTFTWTMSNSIRYARQEGTGTSGSYTKLASWGTTRQGSEFFTSIETPVESNSDCGVFKPTTGMKKHIVPSKDKTVTLTYGVDSDGNPVSSGCAYGFKFEWIGVDGTQKSFVYPY